MNGKIVKYFFWRASIIFLASLIGYLLFLENFDLFEPSDKQVINSKCDYEGLRQAEVFRREGNAVTTPSMQVSVHLGCYREEKNEKLIFTIDDRSLTDNDVSIKWVTFDTLLIEYRSGVRIFRQLDRIEYPDSTLNIVVAYNELE